jgi:hypothetical protein
MSARTPQRRWVIALDDAEGIKAACADLERGVEAGRLRAVAIVAVDSSGGLEPMWGASRTLGPHAGSILRGAVAYLGARMDAEALE